MKVTMQRGPIDEKFIATGETADISPDDKLGLIKDIYSKSVKIQPDYESLKEELVTYDVKLPDVMSTADLSGINKIYAIAQTFFSRVSAVEMIAIDNWNRWGRLVNLMDGYVEDMSCKALLSDGIKELPNARMQQAAVNQKMTKELATLNKFKNYMQEAESFKKQVEIKKKDLMLVLTNLSRQVKVLSIEYSLTRN